MRGPDFRIILIDDITRAGSFPLMAGLLLEDLHHHHHLRQKDTHYTELSIKFGRCDK